MIPIEIGSEVAPRTKGEWSLLMRGQWFRMTAREDVKKQFLGDDSSLSSKLDVYIL